MHWLSFLGGIFVGAMAGVFVMCLCAAAGSEDRRMEKDARTAGEKRF